MPLKHADSMPALKPVEEDRASDDGSHGRAPSVARTESTACFSDSDDESETKVKPHTGHKKVLVTGGA
eukprot:3675882-Ditylum_brightwellii.AAC.1